MSILTAVLSTMRSRIRLPFDLESDPIEIEDDDFGLWYMDITDDPTKYAGKRVKFLAQVAQSPRVPKGAFAAGRFVMTCCVEDITLWGLSASTKRRQA